jgi:hypothetical protein
MSASVTFRGKEITNPILRVLAVVFVVAAVLLAIPLAMLIVFIGVTVTLPLHIALFLCGFNGFIFRDGDSVEYTIKRSSFERRA